jgi:hypothetical protein
MNKAQAKSEFCEVFLAHIRRGDAPALAEAWNNYTDSLHKEGRITLRQYDTWGHPRITAEDWLRAYEGRAD